MIKAKELKVSVDYETYLSTLDWLAMCFEDYMHGAEFHAAAMEWISGYPLALEADPYTPTPDDIQWANMITRMMNDGGVWVFPATGLMYRFKRDSRTLTLVNPDLLASPQVRMYHVRTQIVFGAIGWVVITGEGD